MEFSPVRCCLFKKIPIFLDLITSLKNKISDSPLIGDVDVSFRKKQLKK